MASSHQFLINVWIKRTSRLPSGPFVQSDDSLGIIARVKPGGTDQRRADRPSRDDGRRPRKQP
jgi:hypothetical protein